MARVLLFWGVALYMIAIATVAASAWIPGYESALSTMSRENGFFESISVVLLLIMGVVALYWVVKKGSNAKTGMMFVVASLGLLAIIAAFEEISWGQQLLGFESGEYFKEHNKQQETNLHNFIAPELFSSIIYSSVYTVFVFIPLLSRLLATKIALFQYLTPWVASLHVTLVVLFASLFQVYFYDDFGAWFDFGTLIAGLLLFAIAVSVLKEWNRAVLLHYLVVVMTLGVFMLAHKVFGFYNMQYEIREMFVVFAALLYLREQLPHLERD